MVFIIDMPSENPPTYSNSTYSESNDSRILTPDTATDVSNPIEQHPIDTPVPPHKLPLPSTFNHLIQELESLASLLSTPNPDLTAIYLRLSLLHQALTTDPHLPSRHSWPKFTSKISTLLLSLAQPSLPPLPPPSGLELATFLQSAIQDLKTIVPRPDRAFTPSANIRNDSDPFPGWLNNLAERSEHLSKKFREAFLLTNGAFLLIPAMVIFFLYYVAEDERGWCGRNWVWWKIALGLVLLLGYESLCVGFEAVALRGRRVLPEQLTVFGMILVSVWVGGAVSCVSGGKGGWGSEGGLGNGTLAMGNGSAVVEM